MKFWKPFLLALWIAGITLLLVFYIIPQEEVIHNETIIKLEAENKDLELKNKSLDIEILGLKKRAKALKTKIAYSNQTIQKLENELDKKMDSINRMSAMDLYGYFARFKTDSTAHQ
ncbi:MAG: hypothetical protein ABNH00_11755 [Dokdonia sp.]|jgi:peptidoglycan hydrolase CwlO-like protein